MVTILSALRGSVPALATPFDPDTLAPDLAALSRLAVRAVDRGSVAVVACGSTGEAPALRPEEHARILRTVVEAVGHRVPVIAGVGAPDTDTAVRLAEAAERVGAAALLVSAPPYMRPGQEGLHAHVRAVAARSGLPVMLYDVPSRAGVAFADETIARLLEAGCIAAMKDATADLARPARLRRLLGAAFPQFTGDDATALAHRAVGGAGCVSVTANVAPALCAALQAAWAAGDVRSAATLADLLAPLHDALFAETNPVPLKAALHLLGLAAPVPRLPLVRAVPATVAGLAAAIATVMPEEEARARSAALRRVLPVPSRAGVAPRLLPA